MNIRKMLISDYEKVYDLWMSCKNMGFNDLDDSKAGVKKFLDRNPNTSFVAEEENKIIGIILSGHDGRRGYIYHVCVREECRNKKIGSQPVSKSPEALKNEGINKVALLVFNKNEIGNAFWQKQGFIERVDVKYRNKVLRKITRIDT